MAPGVPWQRMATSAQLDSPQSVAPFSEPVPHPKRLSPSSGFPLKGPPATWPAPQPAWGLPSASPEMGVKISWMGE